MVSPCHGRTFHGLPLQLPQRLACDTPGPPPCPSRAAVGTCVAFVARAANFLVDGVSSRVGKTVGQRAWGDLATHVRLSVRWSGLLGLAAVPLLLLLRAPLLAGLLGLAGDVQHVAAGYWVVRCAAIPLQLLGMAAAGILQVTSGQQQCRLPPCLPHSVACSGAACWCPPPLALLPHACRHTRRALAACG